MAGYRNTIVFERDPALKAQVFKLFATNHGPEGQARELRDLLCCLPTIRGESIGYDNVFRVLIMQFIDAWNFDVRAMKKSCVHIVHPDGRLMIVDFGIARYFKEGQFNDTTDFGSPGYASPEQYEGCAGVAVG